MFRFQLSAFPKCTLEDDYEKLLRSEQGGWIFNSIKRTCDTQTGLTHIDLNNKKKEDNGDIPLKAIRNLVNKELQGSLSDMFTELVRSKQKLNLNQLEPTF